MSNESPEPTEAGRWGIYLVTCEHGLHNTYYNSQGLEYIREAFGLGTQNFSETVTAAGLEPRDAWRQLVDIQEFSHLLFLRGKKKLGGFGLAHLILYCHPHFHFEHV